MKITNLVKYKDNHKFKNILITLLGAFIYAVGITWFILPAGQYTGGFTGLAQLVNDFSIIVFNKKLPINILWFLLNIPVFYLGFKGVGRRFTFLSILSVLFGAIVLGVIPPNQFTFDPMLNAIIGGAITGIGVGITLKVGSSTGGMDIVSQYLSFKGGRSVGQYSFVLNAVIVSIAGALHGWETALYTIINLFIASMVIDKIHTRHQKLTLIIVTDFRDELISAIHKRVERGITIIPGEGAYTRKEKCILFMVITSYELYNVIATIKEVDPNAFTDVIRSQSVFGNFVKSKLE